MVEGKKGKSPPEQVLIQRTVLVAVEHVHQKLVLFVRVEQTIRSPH